MLGTPAPEDISLSRQCLATERIHIHTTSACKPSTTRDLHGNRHQINLIQTYLSPRMSVYNSFTTILFYYLIVFRCFQRFRPLWSNTILVFTYTCFYILNIYGSCFKIRSFYILVYVRMILMFKICY